MYTAYYELRQEPFHVTPDPDFLFPSPAHKEALAAIIYGIEQRKGFVAITGEVGVEVAAEPPVAVDADRARRVVDARQAQRHVGHLRDAIETQPPAAAPLAHDHTWRGLIGADGVDSFVNGGIERHANGFNPLGARLAQCVDEHAVGGDDSLIEILVRRSGGQRLLQCVQHRQQWQQSGTTASI